MKLVTVIGTRPEIIRLSCIIPELDKHFDHMIIHTEQNYHDNLNANFFKELELRKANYYLGARGSFGEQAATIFREGEKILKKIQPDKFLVLGDTNSSLLAIVAARLGIPVYHMEAGNRCYNHAVPEEVNRRLIDHCSDILLPYTQRSKQHLLDEGIPQSKIFVTGNPIYEVMKRYESKINASSILADMGVTCGDYLLVTMHRYENIENYRRLDTLLSALGHLSHKTQVIWSVHPHTRRQLTEVFSDLEEIIDNVKLTEPLGFTDFMCLQKYAKCVLTDSGTVQEESAILGKPCVILRGECERLETVESGNAIIAGWDTPYKDYSRLVDIATRQHVYPPIEEYQTNDVSSKIVTLLASRL